MFTENKKYKKTNESIQELKLNEFVNVQTERKFKFYAEVKKLHDNL